MFTARYTLLPDACGTLSLAFDGHRVRADLWGASLNPALLGAEPNKYQVLLLIQLSPYGLYQLTRQNQQEFADRRVSMAEVDYDLFRLLQQVFITAESLTDLVDACSAVLYSRIEQQVVSDAVLLTVEAVAGSHGQIQVRGLAEKAGYSERHLNRLFLSQIGLSVKYYTRLIRFHYALLQMQKSQCSIASLSQQAGYFDQAHFDKDFRQISGVTPEAYLKNMSDFYYEGSGTFTTL